MFTFRAFLLFALLPLLSVAARAQFYASWYDGKCRMLIVPHDSATGKVVSGLRITLVSSPDKLSYADADRFNGQTVTTYEQGLGGGIEPFVYGLYCDDTLRPSTSYLLVEDIDSCGVPYETMTFPLADTNFMVLTGAMPWTNFNRQGQSVVDSLAYVHLTLARRPAPPKRENGGRASASVSSESPKGKDVEGVAVSVASESAEGILE